MNSENNEIFNTDEFIDNWTSMDKDEKIEFINNPSAETITAITKLLEEFNKTNKNVEDMRKDRNDALIEILKKGDRPVEEIEKIVDLIDKGIKDAADDADKKNEQKIRLIVVAVGAVSILTGTFAPKLNGKARIALISSGSTAIVGALGSATKMGKDIIKAFIE